MCAECSIVPRELYWQLLNSAGCVLWRLDTQGRIRDVSDSVRTSLGHDPKALIGKTIDAVLTGKAVTEARESLVAYLRTIPRPSSLRIVLAHRRADGSELLGEVHAFPAFDEQDRLVEIKAIMREINDHAQIELPSYRREQMLDGILRAVPYGVGVIRDERMVWENDQMVRLTGYSHEEARGVNYRILCQDDLEFQRVSQVLAKGIAETGNGSVETRLFRKDGSHIDALVIAVRTNPPDLHSDLIVTVADITEHKRMEVALRESEKKYRELVEHANSIILRMDPTGVVTFFNEYASRFFGFAPEEIIGRNVVGTIVPATESGGRDLQKMTLDLGVHPERYASNENENVCRDGKRVWVLWTNKPVIDGQDRCTEILSIGNDITERKRAQEEKEKLEAQLRQAQKMEAVGQLAGGVAHDFNNLLQVILGYLEIMRDGQIDGAAYRDAFNSVYEAATRAAELTRQLLAFGRRQVIQPVNLDLNDLIGGVLKLIKRVIGEHIDLRFFPDERLAAVYVDKGLIEQVLVNLCVNARDAMPNGGTLAIGTGNVLIEDEYCLAHPWVEPGPYVLCTVTDTGQGMDEATRARIFEPFFTTKGVGQGTGLGLAMVEGIVKQHGGFIHVYSEPDKGTEFKLYFPASERTMESVGAKCEDAAVGGTETILVAEDSEMVRNSVCFTLQNAGYTVLTACDGEEALRIFEEHADTIDMALLDVMMPRHNGREVMDYIHARRPRIRFLFNSGYSEAGIHTDFVVQEGLRLITKPHTNAQLLRAVRETLDMGVRSCQELCG